MSPSQSKRDAVETASRALRERQRAESGQLAAAESALRRADRDREARGRRHARPDGAGLPNTAEDSEGAGGRSLAMAETRSVLAELGDRLETDEDALDMAAAVHAGHDGVLVATDRRLMFVAPRRRLSLAYARRRIGPREGAPVVRHPAHRSLRRGADDLQRDPAESRERAGRARARADARAGRITPTAGPNSRPATTSGWTRGGRAPVGARLLLHRLTRANGRRHQRRGPEHQHERGDAGADHERIVSERIAEHHHAGEDR